MKLFKLLNKKHEKSADTAKERLQIVVSHNKGTNSLVEKIQGEIIKAISKFVDIDEEQVKIQVIKERNQSALKVDVMLNEGA